MHRSIGTRESAVSRNPRVKVWWMIGIAGLSGCAGLGYEIVWARLLTASLGHEMVAVLGVVAAVFGGLALGSLTFGRRIVESAHPARWYAGLELTIGLWALVLIVLLPATSAMGGTLPALEAMLAPLVSRHAAVGRVYAANTFGAVAGTLATTFALLPKFGLAVTLMICAAVNLACALGVLRWDEPGGAATRARGTTSGRSFGALAPLFLTGLLGIGYEVVAIRVVSQILENTVYTFAVLLAVYLFGTAFG
jgi:spermidine synthase